ncbi:hypothetical protein SNE40_014778 [Patella caerulea]|uniref:Late endosomal/lysosomal adaptor and MAPK and MTOR activator 5 n=1 Tax=Patella caerulea TaxID=87958 RepID=A0AAN8JKS3_PATCE
MEKSLEKHLEETFKIPGVSSVICTDEQGLCLGLKGSCHANVAGPIATLAKQADQLRRTTNAPNPPSICIESEAGSVLIGKKDDITMAIFKSS